MTYAGLAPVVVTDHPFNIGYRYKGFTDRMDESKGAKTMGIGLPQDAEGREIPLDTVAMYDDGGDVHSVSRFIYTNDFDLGDKWMNSWRIVVDDYKTVKPEQMHLTTPDSWERLEEDLDRGSDICDYYEDCPMEMYGKSCSECKKAALKNIASRIRKLRGEGE